MKKDTNPYDEICDELFKTLENKHGNTAGDKEFLTNLGKYIGGRIGNVNVSMRLLCIAGGWNK